jgi:hypothetical protein
MGRKSGKYALVQFCPVPERMEFLNIGVVLIVPELEYVGVKFVRNNARIDRVFGKQPIRYMDDVKISFEHRLRHEFSGRIDEERISVFARKRANDVRISPIQPVMLDNPAAELELLFLELVGKEEPILREPRIRRKLKEAFVMHQVEGLLEEPDDIELPEYDLKINAPYAYQNGCYNLVDGMHISEKHADGLREAGKKAMEGNLLWKHFDSNEAERKRLIIVGDFSRQSNAFYHAVADQMHSANMKLYRLDELNPLLEDIKSNAVLHR